MVHKLAKPDKWKSEAMHKQSLAVYPKKGAVHKRAKVVLPKRGLMHKRAWGVFSKSEDMHVCAWAVTEVSQKDPPGSSVLSCLVKLCYLPVNCTNTKS